MIIEEIKRELELGVRSFLEAQKRSQAQSIDEFEETQILEAAFNRLFLSVEHTINGLVLMETGNFSPKHFGDLKKLKELKNKYSIDFFRVYEETYTFRSYGDYRKFPQIKENFNRKTLNLEIIKVQKIILEVLMIISLKINLTYLTERIQTNLNK